MGSIPVRHYLLDTHLVSNGSYIRIAGLALALGYLYERFYSLAYELVHWFVPCEAGVLQSR